MNTTPSPSADCGAAAAQLARYFETLSPDTVRAVAEHYAADARFKDPFNDVVGLAAIQHIFEHMFAQLEQPRFVVTGQVVQGAQCFLTWEFHFGFKRFQRGQSQVILGASHLVFSGAGLVTLHRDYWDAAEELYEKLPLVGSLMRWLKRRAGN
jgi:ketosteroid isomerase-like protein